MPLTKAEASWASGINAQCRGDKSPDGAPAARCLAQGEGWSVSEYVCTAGPTDRPFEERHEQVTVAAVLEGSFQYRTGTGQAILSPGALLLGNFGSCYECGHDHGRGDRCIALQFAPDYFSEVTASVAASGRFRFPIAMLPAVPRVVPWCVRMEAWALAPDLLEIEQSLPSLLEAVVRAVSGVTPSTLGVSARDERRVAKALRHIELHAQDALNLDALADVTAMSKYHFLRTFRRVVGMTPYQFLLGVRMRRAAARLATSSMPISAIAYEAGFGDLSTFNGRFRDVFGMSPTAYRRHERATSRRSYTRPLKH
ncbi:MAG TPA: AraC family transcriptional regulator [Acetobacteraceae bacterium]|nr:AraC family transcriptional regulator [Acetobacteraceae bacterium]